LGEGFPRDAKGNILLVDKSVALVERHFPSEFFLIIGRLYVFGWIRALPWGRKKCREGEQGFNQRVKGCG